MEIYWSNFRKLREITRTRAESRLQKLAAGHRDLIEVRIVGQLPERRERGMGQVKIFCLARGRQLLAAREHKEFGRALNSALDDLEHGIHRLRERRRSLRRQPRMAPLEAVTQAMSGAFAGAAGYPVAGL